LTSGGKKIEVTAPSLADAGQLDPAARVEGLQDRAVLAFEDDGGRRGCVADQELALFADDPVDVEDARHGAGADRGDLAVCLFHEVA
jgi:hypothetical protein